MRTSVAVCFCAFALHCFQGALCAPVRRAGSSRAAPASEKSPDLKKRGKAPHPQEPLKEASSWTNATNAWSRPRCGVPDSPDQKEERYRGRNRQRRFVLHGGRFDKTDLTYKIVRFPWQMEEDKVRHVFAEAVKIWSDVTPLTFTEVRRGAADIRIDFSSFWHGDNLPFDGPGGILAHAFFPKTHRQGDIHFDYDESWTLGNHMGTDLLQVAAHEFGHVLGLQHSRKPKTIMSAYYSFSYPLRLSDDDKQGIQYLYGARPRAPPPPPPPPPTPAPRAPPAKTETNDLNPDACHTDFEAVSMIRGELFFFKSGYVWRIRDPGGAGRLEIGYPALASRHWRGVPSRIDAAFEDKSGNIWFFQGDYYWVFDAEMHVRGPESIRSLGLTTPGIQAALRWGHDPNYDTYFFKSGSYWRFSPREGRVESPHPRSMQHWPGIPEDVDAAFRDTHGFAHFIRGRQYWKFDPVGMNSLEGYPRYVGVDFFGCRNE